MKNFTARENMSAVERKSQKMFRLKLIDIMINVEYVVEVNEDDYNHAQKGITWLRYYIVK